MTASAASALTPDFVQALRRLAATPCVLSGRLFAGPEGRRGMVATAVTALSAEAPSVVLSIDRQRSLHPVLKAGSRFCVSVLDERHAPLCRVFAGGAAQADRFASGLWAEDEFGVPFLEDATNLFCRTDLAFDYATHTVLAAAVDRVRRAEGGRPIAYADGAVHGLVPLSGLRSA